MQRCVLCLVFNVFVDAWFCMGLINEEIKFCRNSHCCLSKLELCLCSRNTLYWLGPWGSGYMCTSKVLAIGGVE